MARENTLQPLNGKLLTCQNYPLQLQGDSGGQVWGRVPITMAFQCSETWWSFRRVISEKMIFEDFALHISFPSLLSSPSHYKSKLETQRGPKIEGKKKRISKRKFISSYFLPFICLRRRKDDFLFIHVILK